MQTLMAMCQSIPFPRTNWKVLASCNS